MKTKKLISLALLSAVASILMYLDFPLPFFPTFLKFDFGDLPALIAAFAFGPLSGVAVELIKNLAHLLKTSTGGVGELANFLVGSALCIPAGIVYMRRKTKKSAILGLALGCISMALIGALANYYILFPFYTQFMPMPAIIAMCAKIVPQISTLADVILFTIVPFNLFKSILLGLITILIYKYISHLLK